MSAFNELLGKANKWEEKARIPSGVRKKFREAVNSDDSNENFVDNFVDRNKDQVEAYGGKQTPNQLFPGRSVADHTAKQKKWYPNKQMPLPKSFGEQIDMKKSELEMLCDLAKGSIGMGVQRPDGKVVDMGNRAEVQQAKTTARMRGMSIREASPSANTTLPKSINGLKKCAGKKDCGCGCKKGIDLVVDAEKAYSIIPPGRASGSESRSPRPFVRKTRKPDADTQAMKMKSTQGFDMDKFNQENPEEPDNSNFEPIKEPKRVKSSWGTLKTAKRADMTSQENRMKSVSKKKSMTAEKAIGKISFMKSLDPETLPARGTEDRTKFEAAYNSWEPKAKPADYKPLEQGHKKNLNAWAAVGNKDAIHSLMHDNYWNTGQKYNKV